MASRRDGTPTIVNPNGLVQKLQRVPLQARQINEGWLQHHLHHFPEVLPIEEIDAGFSPLVSIGREVGTAVGPIDNLFISPQGSLTIVEAKLWKNPQARREVVGQILDYAKEISRWSYDDLDARAKEKNGKSLWELVSDQGGMEEARFVDAVSSGLRRGSFLLLVVGDGIREEMESLAVFLQVNNQLRFTLALVELQLYRLDNSLLVIPSVVARTTEIVREVIHIRTTGSATVDVSVEIVDEKKNESLQTPAQLNADDFFDSLFKTGDTTGADVARRLFDEFSEDSRFQIDWGAGSYQLKLRDPTNPSHRFTLLVVNRSGNAYVGWLAEQLAKVGLNSEWGNTYFSETAKLLGLVTHPKHGTWNGPLSAVGNHYAEIKARIERVADQVYDARSAESVGSIVHED